jgi:hypothetical protein
MPFRRISGRKPGQPADSDKAIGNSIEKAMTAVAGKLDVTVDDVAEMSVPDHGVS